MARKVNPARINVRQSCKIVARREEVIDLTIKHLELPRVIILASPGRDHEDQTHLAESAGALVIRDRLIRPEI
jgi:hypothetical protein